MVVTDVVSGSSVDVSMNVVNAEALFGEYFDIGSLSADGQSDWKQQQVGKEFICEIYFRQKGHTLHVQRPRWC